MGVGAAMIREEDPPADILLLLSPLFLLSASSLSNGLLVIVVNFSAFFFVSSPIVFLSVDSGTRAPASCIDLDVVVGSPGNGGLKTFLER